jgi:hypothetical protein
MAEQVQRVLDPAGAQHTLEGATNHHREGTALDKALKDCTEHDGLLWKMR